MKRFTHGAVRAVIFCALTALTACSSGIAGNAVHDSSDPCDHDVSYCIYPVFDGSIHVDGQWHEGRFRYRFHEKSTTEREYWFANAWHLADDTRNGSAGK